MYGIMQVYRFTDIKYKSMEIFMYKRIKVYKCAGMQIFKCVGMPLCMYASIHTSKKGSMKD